jgi:hypothetical protein
MRITETLEFTAPPEAVFDATVDTAFQEAVCEATSLGDYTVDIRTEGDRTIVATQRHLPSDDLPSFARSFVGDHFVIQETQDWGPADADGTRVCDLRLHIAGTPLTLTGTITMRAGGPGTIETIDADLRANIPFLGGRIEQAASEPIRAAIEIEGEVLQSHLA